MLQLNGIWFGFGDDDLFQDLSCTLHAGHKLGVVGRNGIGKSTIFNLVRGVLEPEEGEIVMPPRWRIAWLRQDMPATDRPAIEFVVDGHKKLRVVERRLREAEAKNDVHAFSDLHEEYERLGGFQAESQAGSILSGLGFEKADFEKPYQAFSGGWRIRLNLAQTLSQPSDLMLLDEPTNHLDLETTVWLQRWIARYPGTLMCISHDREFLDRTVNEILHLERKSGVQYQGNYSSFELQRAARLDSQAKTYERQEKERQRIQRFIDRFRTYATKAKQVQSRIKMLDRMDATAPLRELSPYSFLISARGKLDRPMVLLDDAVLGYGEHVVLQNVRERIYPGDRIALLGVNGAGKSTFLKALAKELPLLEGRLEVTQHTSIGYFAQHQLELLDADRSAYEHIEEVSGEHEQQIRNFLGSWGFGGDDIFRPISTLSGGEKARLVLAMIVREKPSLLILDEPTNHLDLEMRDALNSALNQYEGAVLMVAHDQHLLRQCADEFWLVRDGTVTHFDGDLDDYEALIADEELTSRQGEKSERTSRRDLRRERARERESRHQTVKRRRQLEAHIEEVQSESATLSEVLADPETMQEINNQELQSKLRRYGYLRKKLQKLENEWSDLVETEEEDC